MVLTKKFSEFSLGSDFNSTLQTVGLSGGNNSRQPRFITWTTVTRPAIPYTGVLGYNATTDQYEYWDGMTWISLASGGGSGTVTSVGTGTGLTGGTITTSGTISFAPIAARSLWVNTSNSSAVPAVTPLTTFLLSANNLSDVPNDATARANLGLAIGSDVEAWSASLDQIAAGVWAGAPSITTLGTIVTGTWEADTIGVGFGGTGATAFSPYAVICGGTLPTNPLQSVVSPGAIGEVLTSNGPSAFPTFQSVAGGGTINSGNANELAWYAASGTTLSGLTTAANGILITSPAGAPSITATFGQGLSVASSQLNVGGANNVPFNNGKGLQDNSGNPLLLFGVTASAVNYLTLTNNAAGSSPSIAATGSDSNISINLLAKGTGGIAVQGVKDASNAASGFVGELVSATVAVGSATALTTNTAKNITSISLTAGDWDVYGNVFLTNVNGMSQFYCWCSTTSATKPDNSLTAAITGLNANMGLHTPFLRVNVSTTTTVYVSTLAVFTISASACGGIFARRRR